MPGFPAVLELSDIDGANGFRIGGGATATVAAGDIDGDGFDDLLTGYLSPRPEYSLGRLVFGRPDFAATVTLPADGAAVGEFTVAPDDPSGPPYVNFMQATVRSTAAAGDIDGDGFDDMLLGGTRDFQLYYPPYSAYYRSAPFAVVGFGGDSRESSSTEIATGTFQSLASAGDFNGDGFSDVLFLNVTPSGASSRNYVVFGSAQGLAATRLENVDGANGFLIDFGTTGGTAGDVNGDDFDDLLLGAPVGSGVPGAGACYVVFGQTGPFAPTLGAADLGGDNGFRVDGIDADLIFGVATASAGDLNGDGFADIVIGAPVRFSQEPGKSYVIFGRAAGFAAAFDVASLDGTNGFSIAGLANSDGFGRSVASAGDIDGDGFDDLLIGAPGADPGGVQDAGSAYLIFGHGGPFAAQFDLSQLDGGNGFRIDGIDAGDNSGQAVSGAGDVNRDGLDDLIVNDRDGAYVIYGDTRSAVIRAGTADDDVLSGGGFNDRLSGLGGDDWLRSNGGNDTLAGGEGDDRIDGGAGNDLLDGGGGSDLADFSGAVSAITVSLAVTTAQNTGAGSDMLRFFENLRGSRLADRLTGSAGANRIEGMDGGDMLLGGDSDDTLAGGDGDDRLEGGSGNDTADYGDTADGVTVSLAAVGPQNTGAGADTLVSIESLRGGKGQDRLSGGAGTNRIAGLGGDDRLSGGDGDDVLKGGDGDDVFAGDAGNDVLDGEAGVDRADFSATASRVNVDLAITVAQNTVGAGLDIFKSIENLDGSTYSDSLAGNSSNNFIGGNSGDDRLRGAGGDDELKGGRGADDMQGGDGDDTLDGGLGNDLLDGGDGNDTIRFDAATRSITVLLAFATAQNTGEGYDTLRSIENVAGSDFNDTLTGSDGANRLDGSGGDDTLEGGAGDDVLVGGNSRDLLDGGDGTDTADYGEYFIGVRVSLAIADYQSIGGFGGDGDKLVSIENLVGSGFADRLAGNAGANRIDGGPGQDLVDYSEAAGGVTVHLAVGRAQNTRRAGFDTLRSIEDIKGSRFGDLLTGTPGENNIDGQGGDDRLYGGGGIDTIFGGDGRDVLHGGDERDVMTGGNGDDLLRGDGGDDQLNGGNDSDDLRGGDDRDSIAGEQGDDTWLSGEAGDDSINGNAGSDRIDGGAGNDFIIGDRDLNIPGIPGIPPGDDYITGGAGNDDIRADGGADKVYGDEGNDRIEGGDGDDRWLSGGFGDDIVFANNTFGHGLDNDRLDGGDGIDQLYGSGGSDFITGGTGNDYINGGFGDDGNGLGILKGENGDDTISGDNGIDQLQGGDGNDRLFGGAGNDVLVGGAGQDHFGFAFATGGNDRVDDWVAADDQIEINASGFGGGLTRGASLAANRLVVGVAPVANQAFGQFLFDTATGQLSWDVDGTGAIAAVAICRLLNGGATVNTLAATDFDLP